MHDPLSSIDAESVEKNVNDAFKIMHKSVKIFSDIPGKRHPSIKLSGLDGPMFKDEIRKLKTGLSSSEVKTRRTL